MTDTTEYNVRGMTCSGCATKVSSAVSAVPGVTTARVDLATGTVQVVGDAVEDAAVRTAITDAGYQVG